MIKLQIIKNFLIILIALFILFILIIPHNKSIEQKKFDGEIYNQATGILSNAQETNLQPKEVKETVPEDNVSEPTLKKFNFYTEEKDLPKDFIGTTTDNKQQADFIIMSKTPIKQEVKKAITPVIKQTKQKQEPKKEIQEKKETVEEPKKQEEVPPTVKEDNEVKEETFNYSILNDIIKNNHKTYFYADNFKNNSDVAVGVYSLTPYKEYHIIKFQVKNNSTSYFFIGNIEIKKGSKLIICKQYCDNMVAKNRTLEGIILAPAFTKNDKIKFKLVESGNKDRTYEITFKIP